MSLREKFRQQKRELLKKHKHVIENRETYGYSSIINKDKLPKGIGIWSCGEGKHIIDIIPYEVGKINPHRNEGEIWHYLELWVHRNVGPRKEHFVCPSANPKIRKPCPICEYQDKMRREGKLSSDEIKELYPKRRVIYLIWCHDSEKEEKKGIQVWEVAHWFMQDKLDELAESPRGGGLIHYFDPDKGKSISFKRKGTGQGNTAFTAHSFLDREEVIPDKILEQTFPLEDVVKIPSYDEIAEAFFGKEGEETSETEEGEIEEPSIDEKKENEEDIPDEIVGKEEKGECPYGHKFGEDADEYEDCLECDKWDDCFSYKEGK